MKIELDLTQEQAMFVAQCLRMGARPMNYNPCNLRAEAVLNDVLDAREALRGEVLAFARATNPIDQAALGKEKAEKLLARLEQKIAQNHQEESNEHPQ